MLKKVLFFSVSFVLATVDRKNFYARTGERRGWIFIIFRRNEISNENLSTWWKQNIYKLINNDNYFECESQIERSR